ncbi:MAG: lamin tail domain-containing protein [Methanothrix sp.]|nr:lamin tail domain-containing protein [Methanothrix sp.]
MKIASFLSSIVPFIIIAVATGASSQLVNISDTQFDAPGDDKINLNGEWVKIINEGTSPISMSCWTLSDEGNKHLYRFPIFTLDAGASVKVYTGSGTDTATELYFGQSLPVWNNDGDTATLEDSNGSVVAQWSNRQQSNA